MSPSEKARCHRFTAKGMLRHLVVPMTLQHIGEVMSLGDPHYCPGASNPFADLSQFREGKKIVCSNKELFSSCFELPSPSSGITPPNSPENHPNLVHSGKKKLCLQKSAPSQSVPNSPKLLKKTLVRMNSSRSDEDTQDGWAHSKELDAKVFCKCESLHCVESSSVDEKPFSPQDSNALVFPKVSYGKESAYYDSGYYTIPSNELELGTTLPSSHQRDFSSSCQILSDNHGWQCHDVNKRPSSCYSDDSGIGPTCNSNVDQNLDKKNSSVDKENAMNGVNTLRNIGRNENQSFVWSGSPECKEFDKNALPTSPSHYVDTKK